MSVTEIGSGHAMPLNERPNQNEAPSRGDRHFVEGANGRPEPVDHMRRQMVEAGFFKDGGKKKTGLSQFTAMAGRFVQRFNPFSSKQSSDAGRTPNVQVGRNARTEPDQTPQLARKGVNGVTQGQLARNIALIDKMTPGDEKLPQNIKIMLGLSPTLMEHLQKYDRAGCEFDIVPNTPGNEILMAQKDFADITLPKDFMGLEPREFIIALAETLILNEVSNLHPEPLFKESPYNKDNMIDLGAAMANPFGKRAYVVAEAEFNREGRQQINEHHEWPKAKLELMSVFQRHHDLTEPTMAPPRIKKTT
ncbi:MAG: hypothetical protein AAFQ09_07870 [Pseudomonadota bacterium]